MESMLLNFINKYVFGIAICTYALYSKADVFNIQIDMQLHRIGLPHELASYLCLDVTYYY